MTRTIGVVLAGGRSSRMGVDKARVEVAGRPMVDWVVAGLRTVVSHVVLAGRHDPNGADEAIPDDGGHHRGPLAGIVTAHLAHPEADLVVVAVDQPWVRSETLQRLVERGRQTPLPVVPVDAAGIRQTTCAVYAADSLADAATILDAGGSCQTLLDETSFVPITPDIWGEWGEDGRSWRSIDSPADLDAAHAEYGDMERQPRRA